ncbi:MAG: glycosyltransferase family 4 protein [Candidatus Aenigmatarchaeota archaeon]
MIKPNITKSATSGVFGFVDSIDEKGISGWILDLDEGINTIEVYINDTKVIEKKADIWREDISIVIGKPVNCGFFIPWKDLKISQINLKTEDKFYINIVHKRTGKLISGKYNYDKYFEVKREPISLHEDIRKLPSLENITESVTIQKVAVFTIASKNYMSYVRVLMSSIEKIHPEWSRFLFLADLIDGYFDPKKESFITIEVEKIGIPTLLDMITRYNITEFNTAVKPFAFKWLLINEGYDAVIYLDPDIEVFSPLEKVVTLLNSGASMILTPHICRPIEEDGKKPSDYTMLYAGVFNLGFMAARKCFETINFMNWWAEKLKTFSVFDVNLHVDQKWCDLAPCFLDNLAVLRDEAYNVAYWNLMHRKIKYSDGKYYVNEKPLVFFHFSGIVVDDDNNISKHQDRYTLEDIPELKPLFKSYRKKLLDAEWKKTSRWPYAYESGIYKLLSPIVKMLYRSVYKQPLNLKKVSDIETVLIPLCNEPVYKSDNYVITRLMKFIYDLRPDLQKAFDLTSPEGRFNFYNWYIQSAKREYNIDDLFIPPFKNNKHTLSKVITRTLLEYSPADIPQLLQDVYISKLMHWVWLSRPDLQECFDISTAEGQQAFTHWFLVSFEREYRRKPIIPKKEILSTNAYTQEEVRIEGLPGANLIGYAYAVLGMGEHVRNTAKALHGAGIPFGIYNFSIGVEGKEDRTLTLYGVVNNKNIHKANIFHINADQMLLAYTILGHEFFANKYNIGYWAWELSKVPADMAFAVNVIDEIWAPSRFIQEAFAEVTTLPVVHMPLLVELPEFKKLGKSYFGIPEESLMFLFIFDFLSYPARKNPYDVVRAFKIAFPKNEKDVFLVLKTMYADINSDAWRILQDLIGGDNRIYVINSVMSQAEVYALIDACDCFVSLHRSEGFGRCIAEAMYLGKPVIATNYSGNTDFTLPDNSCLVDFKLIPVKEGEYPGYKGQVWAQPDIEHAAFYMRKVYEDKSYREGIALRARNFILENYSVKAIGKNYAERLKNLGLLE